MLSGVPVIVWCKQGFLSGDGPLSDIDIDDVSVSEKQMLVITQLTKYLMLLILT